MHAEKRRALISVSDKTQIESLAAALIEAGFEIIATGNTREVLKSKGYDSIDVETITQTPEAFGGRMKTLSFRLLSGVLYHRERDQKEAKTLGIDPIEMVVVNFYPFEKQAIQYRASDQSQSSFQELIEKVDIGGPTLVRAAAKNCPAVSVIVDPSDYDKVISELKSEKKISPALSKQLAEKAWARVYQYDQAIVDNLVSDSHRVGIESGSYELRYGENPHQKAWFAPYKESPLDWYPRQPLTANALSYNNFLDVSAGYTLLNELVGQDPGSRHCVIIKHLSPCGVASVPQDVPHANQVALELAWQGDPVSSFGGVVLFSHPIDEKVFSFFYTNFIDTLVAPQLDQIDAADWQKLISKRKSLKAVSLCGWGNVRQSDSSPKRRMEVGVPGGRLIQEVDDGVEQGSEWSVATKKPFKEEWKALSEFGISCVKSLKSNAVALVRAVPLENIRSGSAAASGSTGFAKQLVGTGQGQPNRVEAIEWLAVPRAKRVMKAAGLSECVLFSDAFFPFPDAVEIAARAGIQAIVQPGGSIKDKDCVEAADRLGVAMAFTGKRHFRH